MFNTNLSFLWVILQVIGQRIWEYKAVAGVSLSFWEMCTCTFRYTVFLSKTDVGDSCSVYRSVAHVLRH